VTADDRFWSNVRKSKDCWDWTGRFSKYGYGQVRREGREMRAHRLAWTLRYGPIPQGMCVLHLCDRPSCVRPEHLYLGTRFENVQDRCARAMLRSGRARGIKITAAEVVELRRQWAFGEISTEQLGLSFGLEPGAASAFVVSSRQPAI
jgi:hypothetical protein